MLRRSNVSPEVSMFSLIALYFDYRRLQAARALTLATGAAQPIQPANDRGSNRTVASAA
ncbi:MULTISPECIES: hypothetical protein [unclassified Sphingomonas]|uniref:hypothetical protein n=1 Tax=unclassified Sphingomonas TaxID=196159 RepID=UPI0015E713FA|nr:MULTISPECIES: hypothetical protein [unclassified Sphingomonas]MBE2990960.1 hypothetical protein [Sphingomonas sp. CFBP 13603]